MLYRESGQFKTSYLADQTIFPIAQDRWFVAAVVLFAFLVMPLVANEYLLQAALIPLLIFSLAALGLNLLVGYAGQLSLGTGGFMAVGAYMAYKMTTAFPEVNILIIFLLSGVCAAGVVCCSGFPACASRGFTWRSPPWRRNSSSAGCSTRSAGSTTTTPPARSPRRRASSSVWS